MKTIAFKVFGLDCIEEVRIIKESLSPLIESDYLHFDLLNGKLTIQENEASLDAAQISAAIKKGGLKAVEWQVYIEQSQSSSSFFRQYGRLILTIVSIICLLSGFLVHVYTHGFYNALSGGLDDLAYSKDYPYITLSFYSLAIISGGWFIFPKALFAIRRLSADMNLLMTIAVIGAIVISQWFEAATVTTLFLIALLLESWSIERARKAIKGLLTLTPDKALCYCKHDKEFEPKALSEIAIDSIILVKPGEKIPLDGEVIEGEAYINESPITGESTPVDKTQGSIVYAGSINGNTSFKFKTTKLAEDTILAHVIQMVEQAQSRRANSEKWVEKFARYYTPLMILFAITIAVFPPLLLGLSWSNWFYEALVILVIACPCALVISTPVSIVAGLSSSAKNGILIKGGNFLEKPAQLSAIAFDKTGTITTGKPSIQEIIPLTNHSSEHLLTIAAALEMHSNHPLSAAIIDEAQQLGLTIPEAHNFKIHQGKGADGLINGQYFWIGSHRWLHEKFPSKDNGEFHNQAQLLEDKGHSLVIIGTDDHICGLLSIADEIKPGINKVIAQLKKLDIAHITMLTGDNQGTAKAIASYLNLDNYAAELLPEDKVKEIEQLTQQYNQVAMVGDGINDAPAMACSSLGIAMGAIGSDAAIETADIALMSDDIGQIPRLIQHSKRTLRIIKQNITFALLIKAAFIILALFELASLWLAIAADMGASLIVIFNGLRLLKMQQIPAESTTSASHQN